MLRALLLSALITVATGAAAQTSGGPSIAYVKRANNGDEIFLVTPQNSGLIRLYKAPGKVQVTMLDLRPGGGEIAFTEGYLALKVLAFDDLGRPLAGNPRTIRRVSSPCTVEAPDYHPADRSFLFVEGCGRNRAVWRVQEGASSADPTPLFSSLAVYRARWSRLGDQIYYIGLRDGASASDPTYLYRRNFISGETQEVGVLNSWSTFDVARTGEKLFWSNGNATFSILDLGSTGATTNAAQLLACPRGMRMSYSPDDGDFVFTSDSSRGGHYVMVGPSSCGSPTALTGKASWGWVDWRN